MNTKTLVRAGIAVLSGAVLLAPTAAFAGPFTDQVRYQLLQAAIALGLSGNFELTHDPYVDALDDGDAEYITLTLRRGTTYGIVGVCDEDCRDIDLGIYDGNGNLIDSDIEYDDYPTVSVSPRWSGQYQLRVKMASCESSPCYYGVGVFGR